MLVEDEMKREIERLRQQLALIDAELEKINKRSMDLLMSRKKKEHDLKVLLGHFNNSEDKETQKTLANLLRK